jgi:hypothetical protein
MDVGAGRPCGAALFARSSRSVRSRSSSRSRIDGALCALGSLMYDGALRAERLALQLLAHTARTRAPTARRSDRRFCPDPRLGSGPLRSRRDRGRCPDGPRRAALVAVDGARSAAPRGSLTATIRDDEWWERPRPRSGSWALLSEHLERLSRPVESRSPFARVENGPLTPAVRVRSFGSPGLARSRLTRQRSL